MTHAEKRSRAKGQGAGPRVAGKPVVLDPKQDRLALMVEDGYRHYQSGDLESANAIWRSVLDEDLEHPGALHGMGVLARDMERYEVSVELMRRALLRDPFSPAIHSNLGTALEQWGRYDAAVTVYKAGIKLSPNDWILHNNLGSCYARMGRRILAIQAFQKAIRFGGDTAELLTNYAATLADTGDFEKAEPFFKRALEVDPAPSALQFAYGAQLQKQGRWNEGWHYYERRFLKSNWGVRPRYFPQPFWDGVAAQDRSLLVWGEQGIGDEIRFASMIPDVIAGGAHVTIECAPKLASLFARSFPGAKVELAPFTSAETGDTAFDAQAPFGSLGRIYRSKATDFPRRLGYLVPDPARTGAFKQELSAMALGLKVGICWRSGLLGAFRNDYYTTVRELGPMLKVPGVTFINLQYDVRDDEIKEARSRFGVGVRQIEGLNLKDDLDGAAALAANLDLVVSAATSVSCMAGALGVPTLEFRPTPVADGFLIDGHCPWFASLRYVDKKAGDPWSTVFRKIASELKALASQNRDLAR
jgi:tetratricopeptide (TPR) repeat protein